MNQIRGNYKIFLPNNFCAAVKCVSMGINCIKTQHTVSSEESEKLPLCQAILYDQSAFMFHAAIQSHIEQKMRDEI